MEITLSNINKQFGTFRALDDVNLTIESGELIALLGPSGSGKTTLLRIIAGLEHADTGVVSFGGADMANTPLRERQIGFVFQHYALFKHMTVRDNVGFGLSVRPRGKRPPSREIRRRANELLDLDKLAFRSVGDEDAVARHVVGNHQLAAFRESGIRFRRIAFRLHEAVPVANVAPRFLLQVLLKIIV